MEDSAKQARQHANAQSDRENLGSDANDLGDRKPFEKPAITDKEQLPEITGFSFSAFE